MTPKEAKNYVAGTLERDRPYERLLRQVVLEGELTHDRTGVGTLSTFGTRMEFNLQDGFPLVTTKKVFLRGIIAELLWFIAGDNKVSTLQKQNVRIWDEWVLPDGTIGKGYPIQWRSWPKTDGTTVDQLSNALDLIRHNPSSRRIIVSAWNAGELDEMALPPCHALFQFHVRGDGFLDCQLYQRSADMFLGVPFNIASYSLLTMMMAQQAGLEPLSCPTILDSKYMPGQGRYECEYVDAKGKAHDLSLLVASGDRVWLYDHNGKPMKVTTK